MTSTVDKIVPSWRRGGQPERRSQRRAPSSGEALGRLAQFLRRLGFAALVLLAIVYLSFFGLEMARGSSFGEALSHGLTAGGRYLARLARGDLGLTTSAGRTALDLPVAEVLWPTVSRSLGLLAASLFIAVVLGIPLGAWAARRRRSSTSIVTLLVSLAGMSLPSFFVALLLQMAMIKWVRTFGGRAPLPVGGFGWDAHIVLPALVLATRPLAQIARVTFISLSEVLDQDYVRTAYSKGLSRRSVWQRHVYRNAAIPILTTLLTSLHFSLSSLPVVERFFNWTGMGFNLLRSIARQDDNLTVVLLLCLGGLFILVNLFLEVVYRRIDPRVAEQEAERQSGRRMGNALTRLKQALDELIDQLRALGLRLARRPKQPENSESGFRDLLQQQIADGQYYEISEADRRSERRRAWLQGTLGNPAFALGAVLLVGLLAVVLLGARFAPHSPYVTQGLTITDGELSTPPYSPSEVHPWGTDIIGRDILSLVLVGARRTLSMAVVIVLARMVLGFIMGALAGWNAGSALDRLVMGLSEVIAPFPALLLAMILILAMGIREGVSTFIIAFCFVGWGEVMQYVRSEVITIRPQLYIESAEAAGLRTIQIVYRHVFPNLVSALIVLAALEMGAVLMLLAELGFIDIFIGGGTFAELDIGAAPYHYSDVPEWGAMLSNVRLGARSWPWTAIYPSLAFAISILAFNMFGEGLRRMIDRVGVGFTRVINRTTVLAAVVFVLGIQWAGRYVGPSVYYREYAQAFSGQQALSHVEVLADPALSGRGPSTLGRDAAAEYIAGQFKQLGLQSAGEDGTYFQTRLYNFTTLDAIPRLTIHDGGEDPVYREDFAEYVGRYRNLGDTEGTVRWLGMGQLSSRFGMFLHEFPALANVDTAQDVLLVLSQQNAAAVVEDQARQAILIVAESEDVIKQRRLMTAFSSENEVWGTGRTIGYETPAFWITEDLANRMLAGTGQTVATLRDEQEALGRDEVAVLPTMVRVSSEITGTTHEKESARNIIAFMPGTRGRIEGAGGETQMDNQMIMVLAQYDGVGEDVSGTPYPGANDNASGVAVMLEAIRTLQQTDYTPYRTFMFVAYAGEGNPHGLAYGRRTEPTLYLQARRGFSSSYNLEAVIYLRGLGNGTEPAVEIAAGGSQRLLEIFEDAAQGIGVKAKRGTERLDISVVFEEGSAFDSAAEAPGISLSTVGWQETNRTTADTVDSISVERLEDAGELLALSLMVLGREEY